MYGHSGDDFSYLHALLSLSLFLPACVCVCTYVCGMGKHFQWWMVYKPAALQCYFC